MAASGSASAQPASQKVALYANVGADLTHYDLDIAGAARGQCDRLTFDQLACNMPGRTHRDVIFMLRPAAVLQVLAWPAQSITSPRCASIRRAAV